MRGKLVILPEPTMDIPGTSGMEFGLDRVRAKGS